MSKEPYDLFMQERNVMDQIDHECQILLSYKLNHLYNIRTIRGWRLQVKNSILKQQDWIHPCINQNVFDLINSNIQILNNYLDEINVVNIATLNIDVLTNMVVHNFKMVDFIIHKFLNDTDQLLLSPIIFKYLKSKIRNTYRNLKVNILVNAMDDIHIRFSDESEYIKRCVNRSNFKLKSLLSFFPDNEITYDVQLNQCNLNKLYIDLLSNIIYMFALYIYDHRQFNIFVRYLPSKLKIQIQKFVHDLDRKVGNINIFLLRMYKIFINFIFQECLFFPKEKLSIITDLNLLLQKIQSIDLQFICCIYQLPKYFVIGIPLITNQIKKSLMSYASGNYDNTLKHMDQINHIASIYKTRSIQLSSEKKISLTKIKKDIDKLIFIINEFGNGRNSKYGAKLINNFKEEVNHLFSAINLSEPHLLLAYNHLMESYMSIEHWINRSWWQAGGQPLNHKKAGKHDSSKVTYQRPIYKTRASEHGNSLK